MMFRSLRLERLLTLLLLLLFLAALTFPLYTLSFKSAVPSTLYLLNLIPRTNLSSSSSDTSSPDNNDLSSSICGTRSPPTTTGIASSQSTHNMTASPAPQCFYNSTGCGAIFSLVQTCYDSLFPSDSTAYAITPGNPAQAAGLRSCICSSSSESSKSSSASSKNTAWTHCLSCLYNSAHALQTDITAQTRALRTFCQAPGVPDAVGWLRGFEAWIGGLAPAAIGVVGGDGKVLSGGVAAVLTMTETATPTGRVTAAMATQTKEASSSTDGTTGGGGVVTSIYSVNGQTTLLIVRPAPTTTSASDSEHTTSSLVTSASASRSAIHDTTVAATEQASAATKKFRGPPVGNGDMAFGVGLGVFIFLGIVRFILN